MSRPWLEVVERFAHATGTPASTLAALHAFGGGEASSGPADFAELEASIEATLERQRVRIPALLTGEIDAEQAAMFARRFMAVASVLAEQSRALIDARVLRIGLVRRMEEVLDAPGPRALRVRALADFYYSHAAVLHHQGQSAPVAMKDAATRLRWRDVAPGIRHGLLVGPGPRGPLHVNVLRLQDVRLRCVAVPRDGRAFERYVDDSGATTAISGGFFLYSEPDIALPSRRTDPVGLLVDAGRVLSPPVFHRSTLLQHATGAIAIARVGLVGATVLLGGTPVTIAAANAPPPIESVTVPTAYNRAYGPVAPSHAGHSVAIVGHTVTAVAAGGAGALPIPLAGVVLALPPETRPPEPGSTVTWSLPHSIDSAIAGGPRLLHAGAILIDREAEELRGSAPPITFSQDETFDQNLLPRMAAGLTDDGTVLLVAADGRSFEHAPGLTLALTGELMHALGCTVAMNLDGGSSKRMVVQGRVVDLPSTEVQTGASDRELIRPVYTAVLAYPASSRSSSTSAA